MSGAIAIDDRTEWLEADGQGGFASGTTLGVRTRRYHALLLAATTPPTGRMVLVNGLDAWVESGGETEFLTRQRYAPGALAPEHGATLESFTDEPWPTWTYRLADGSRVEHELFVPHGRAAVALRWRLMARRDAALPFAVRPFLSGRDSHALHHENPAFRFEGVTSEQQVTWQPYDGVPAVHALSNGGFDPESAVVSRVPLLGGAGARAGRHRGSRGAGRVPVGSGRGRRRAAARRRRGARGRCSTRSNGFNRLHRSERARRARFATRLERAGDAYLVRRDPGKTIVAGYPWFTDWGRDTFISLRGLCLATGRLDDARAILLEWADLVSEGMLPNRFVDQGDGPEYNTVDASLWYVIAAHEYLEAAAAAGRPASARDRKALGQAVQGILAGHVRGTRYGIRVADDGLLAAGEPGVQLTWMDAKVGDWVVTPRIGKPVEVQALWLNALRIAERFTPRYAAL